jgi:plasmid maintenance system killer protein
MIGIIFLPTFVKLFNKLESDLQSEVLEKIDLFKNPRNHEQLKVHKLHGKLKNRYSFYVNYKFRIIFTYVSKKEAVLLTVGDHEVYK